MGTSVDEETGEESTAQLWKAALQTDWSGTVFDPSAWSVRRASR